MVISSCPDSAQSIFAAVKFFISTITVYSLLGPPMLLITIDDKEDVGVTVVGKILSVEFEMAVTIVVLITEESIVFVTVVGFKEDSEGSTVVVVVVVFVVPTVEVGLTAVSVTDAPAVDVVVAVVSVADGSIVNVVGTVLSAVVNS